MFVSRDTRKILSFPVDLISCGCCSRVKVTVSSSLRNDIKSQLANFNGKTFSKSGADWRNGSESILTVLTRKEHATKKNQNFAFCSFGQQQRKCLCFYFFVRLRRVHPAQDDRLRHRAGRGHGRQRRHLPRKHVCNQCNIFRTSSYIVLDVTIVGTVMFIS